MTGQFWLLESWQKSRVFTEQTISWETDSDFLYNIGERIYFFDHFRCRFRQTIRHVRDKFDDNENENPKISLSFSFSSNGKNRPYVKAFYINENIFVFAVPFYHRCIQKQVHKNLLGIVRMRLISHRQPKHSEVFVEMQNPAPILQKM